MCIKVYIPAAFVLWYYIAFVRFVTWHNQGKTVNAFGFWTGFVSIELVSMAARTQGCFSHEASSDGCLCVCLANPSHGLLSEKNTTNSVTVLWTVMLLKSSAVHRCIYIAYITHLDKVCAWCGDMEEIASYSFPGGKKCKMQPGNEWVTAGLWLLQSGELVPIVRIISTICKILGGGGVMTGQVWLFSTSSHLCALSYKTFYPEKTCMRLNKHDIDLSQSETSCFGSKCPSSF